MVKSHIEKTHEFNKLFLEHFKVKEGSEIKYKNRFGEIKKVEIAWINPHWFWFGSKEQWILPKQVIEIEGKDVQGEILKMKEDFFNEVGMMVMNK